MAIESSWQGDIFINGNVRPKTLSIPSGTLIDAGVNANADIAATKLEHQNVLNYSQESDTTAASEAKTVHTVYGTTGGLVSVKAGAVVANEGDSAVSIELLKNGTTVLAAPIVLNTGQTAFEVVSGSISSTSLTAEDVLEIEVTPAIGTGTLAKGVFVTVVERELSA